LHTYILLKLLVFESAIPVDNFYQASKQTKT